MEAAFLLFCYQLFISSACKPRNFVNVVGQIKAALTKIVTGVREVDLSIAAYVNGILI